MSKYFKPVFTILILTVFCSTFVLLHTQISESSDSQPNNERCIGDMDAQWSPKNKCEGTYFTQADCMGKKGLGKSVILSVISTRGCIGYYEGYHCVPKSSFEEVLVSKCSWDKASSTCVTPSTTLKQKANCKETSP